LTLHCRLLRFLFLSLWVLCASSGLAQRYSFVRYSIEDGLVQSQVRCLYQDPRGFIWAGTLGGVSRFDGHSFVNFDRQDGLPDNQVNCISADSSGRIVLGMNGYISFIDGTGLRALPLGKGYETTSVQCIINGPQGQLWMGTESGLMVYRNDAVYPLRDVQQNVRSMLELANGQIAVVCKDEILLWNGQSFALLWKPSREDVSLFDAVEMTDGTLWVATKGAGLIQLKEGMPVASVDSEEQLPASAITNLTRDAYGNVWMSSRYGFAKFNGATSNIYGEKSGLETADVRDVLCDREGNIWLATYGGGLMRFCGDAFSAYTKADGLSSDAIMSIVRDAAGVLWLGTYDGGICQLSKDTVLRMDDAAFFGNNRIWSSVVDAQGVCWFGASEGLYCVRNGKLNGPFYSSELPDKLILSLWVDTRNRLWIGTAKGPALMESERNILGVLPDETRTRIRCIREDRSGQIWMATSRGLVRYNGVQWDFFSEKDGLPDNSIYSLEVDALNRLWVGTQNGLAQFNGQGFFTARLGETSASNSINFLKYIDQELWVGTNNGLYQMRCGQEVSLLDPKWLRYGVQDGLRSTETNLNAVFLDRDERLWFGTTEGVMVLDRMALQRESILSTPQLALTNIQINLRTPDWATLGFEVNTTDGLPVNPVLDYKKNHLTFYFTGIATSHPDEVEYQFFLKGFEEDWQSPTKANFTTYSNLPYEEFVFVVRTRESGGEWGPELQFPFRIQPPFWLTWWFIALEVLAAACLVWLFMNYRRRIRNERLAKDQYALRSRLLALEQQSLNSSMNRHFIFNALNSIQYYINRQDKLAANKYLTDFARLIRKNLDHTSENMATLREEIERLELYLRLEHMRFKDKFEYSIEVDPALEQDKIKVPAMLVQPFLENSIWHGLLPKEGAGSLRVKVDLENAHLVWTISDNGIGIENSLRSKTGTDEHISRGMEITTSRIELIKKMTGKKVELIGPQQINDENGMAAGTLVKIILPDHFHELF
jgi:ligand-binding sensor domain-containing protein